MTSVWRVERMTDLSADSAMSASRCEHLAFFDRAVSVDGDACCDQEHGGAAMATDSRSTTATLCFLPASRPPSTQHPPCKPSPPELQARRANILRLPSNRPLAKDGHAYGNVSASPEVARAVQWAPEERAVVDRAVDWLRHRFMHLPAISRLFLRQTTAIR